MSSGASFPWTFDQVFAGNVAPKADETTVSRRGTLQTDISRRGTRHTEVSHQ
jgi:hypothetical protein